MAYKFQVGSATMSGSLVQEGEIKILNEAAAEHAKLTQAGVVSGSGEAAFGSIKLGGTAVSSTAAELNLVDGSSAGTIVNSKAVVYGSSGEVNATTLQIAGTSITATAAELNYLDNSDLTAADITKLAALTATAAEINYLDNDDLTAADITKLAALTATAAEINYLDNDDLTAADITKLAALTATAAEINYLDLTNAIGTVGASEAVVVDSNKDVSGFRNIDGTGDLSMGTVTMTGFSVDADGDTSAKSLAATDLTAYASSEGSLPLINSSKVLVSDAGFVFSNDRGMQGYNYMAVSSSASGSGYLADGLVFVADTSGDDILVANADGIGMGYDSSLQSGEGDNVFSFSPGDGEIKLQYDGTAITFGADSDVELMHIADTGLRLNDGMGLSFRDGAININSDADGMLDISADNSIDINVNGSEMLSVQNNLVVPGADDAVDLGSSGLEFKDLYIDGVAYIDSLQADQLGAALDANNQAITNINVDGGAIDGTTVGATTPAAGVFTTLQANGQVTIGDASDDGVDWNAGSLDMTSNALTWQIKDGVDGFSGNGALLMFTGSGGDFLKVNTSGSQKGVVFPRTFYPSSDDAVDIGASDKKFKDIYIDGVAYLDDVDGVTADFSSTLNVDGLSTMAGITADGAIDFSNTSIQFSGDLDTAFAPSADAIYFRDADGSFHSRSWSTIMGQIAGAGLTATNGVLSSDASATPTDHGDADGTLVEGLNFSDSSFTAARSWTLPASPDVGDVVTVKAPTNASTYNLTIVKAGSQKIDGVSQDLIIESDNGAVSLVYAKDDRWVIS